MQEQVHTFSKKLSDICYKPTQKYGQYFVGSKTDRRIEYVTSLSSCTCGSFVYHGNNPCKHMISLSVEIIRVFGSIREFESALIKQNEIALQDRVISSLDLLTDFQDGMDAYAFEDKYGEGTLRVLKDDFEVVERHGKIYRM